uniref:Transcription factor n=1 Tax=Globodera pallida TaxID=36090 RepID=A0A183CDK7_GLOPA
MGARLKCRLGVNLCHFDFLGPKISKSGQRGFVWQIDSEFVQSFADATAGYARQLQIPLFANPDQAEQRNCPDASAPDEHQRHHSTARGTWRHNTRRATSHQQQAQNAATATEPNSNSSGGTIDVAMMELDGAGAAQRQQSGQSADFPRVSLPLDDSLDEALLPLGLTVQHALKFQMDYEAHNREVLECLRNFRLESVENVWARFWAGASESDHAEGAAARRPSNAIESVPAVHGAAAVGPCAARVDLCFSYQLLLDQLLPDLLCPSLPAHAHGTAHRHQLLLPQMRPFAKNLCACMAKALGDGAPSALRELKLAGVRLLSNAFTRLSSVAHLAITAREVLHSDEQMAQMHADFDRLDFPVLHEQAEVVFADPFFHSHSQSFN